MSKEDQRFFQFLAGDRQGEVVVYDHIEEDEDLVFVCFKDGSRCNEELILKKGERKWNNEFMAEVPSTNPDNLWTFDTKWVGRQEERWSRPEDSPDGEVHLVQPFVKGRKKVTPKPPRKVKSVFGAIDKRIESAPPKSERSKYEGDPVWLMMEKAKKFDTDVEMSVTISLPSKSLYDVAKESFEEGGPKVIEYIIENLDNQKLKDSLKVALEDAYGEPHGEEPPEYLQQGVDLGEPEAIEEPVISGPVAKDPEELKESEKDD